MTESAPDAEAANVHLQMLGERRVFPLPLRLGKRTPLDLLPAARELTHQVTAIVVDQAVAQGKRISCQAGCGACCRQLVGVSLIEAVALADVVAALPPERQAAVQARFADAVRRLEAADLIDPARPPGQRGLRSSAPEELPHQYFRLQIACPFLENESCSIHPERPLVCREYHVTSPPEHCKRQGTGKIESVQPPLHMNQALATAGSLVAAVPDHTVPLVLALEKAALHADALRQPGDGATMCTKMLEVIDQQARRPFEERPASGG
jgi:Fe-S-cluster containining protein